jgi:MFS family permease
MFLSLLISGQAILLVALMTPVGITAVFLIVILRFIQGMGLGGDMGSSIVLSYKFAEKGKRTRYFTSFPMASAVLGMMLGVLGILLSERLESKIFLLTYGWRIWRILMSVGTITIIVSAYLRMRMLLH